MAVEASALKWGNGEYMDTCGLRCPSYGAVDSAKQLPSLFSKPWGPAGKLRRRRRATWQPMRPRSYDIEKATKKAGDKGRLSIFLVNPKHGLYIFEDFGRINT